VRAVTPRAALQAALDWCAQFRYVPERAEFWDTARDLERNLGADCDGFAVACIQQAHEAADEPKPTFYLIVGRVPQGGHAWVEMEAARERLWADPTPEWPKEIQPPSWWAGRSPMYAYRFDGVIFSERYAYEEVR